MGYAPVVPYEGRFLIVGGNDQSDRPLDTIIRYRVTRLSIAIA